MSDILMTLTAGILLAIAVGVWALALEMRWTRKAVMLPMTGLADVGRSIAGELVAHREAVSAHRRVMADGMFGISRIMANRSEAESERYKETREAINRARQAAGRDADAGRKGAA
jgi:hypothetical protein